MKNFIQAVVTGQCDPTQYEATRAEFKKQKPTAQIYKCVESIQYHIVKQTIPPPKFSISEKPLEIDTPVFIIIFAWYFREPQPITNNNKPHEKNFDVADSNRAIVSSK
jgi:hypothetical protein